MLCSIIDACVLYSSARKKIQFILEVVCVQSGLLKGRTVACPGIRKGGGGGRPLGPPLDTRLKNAKRY